MCNLLRASQVAEVGVEDVQRMVLQQLWAAGLFQAAEHYQNYREERRKARLQAPVPTDVQGRFDHMQRQFLTDLQVYQFMSKFARWRDDDRRRETWDECCQRVCNWLFALPGVELRDAEKRALHDAMAAFEVSPAMRVVQMAGPALDRCNVGAYNCSYHPLQDIRAFSELLYILMQGTGAGFSVEDRYVSQLPRVKRQRGSVVHIQVEDSTEGWCDAFDEALNALWDGHDITVDYSLVRKKNSRLRTKGGRSSGPEALRELIDFARSLLLSRQGRCLEDIDAHDIACKIGTIVQVGGVRRAAEISLSDLHSTAMRDAKSGPWYQGHRHRTMANNSAVYGCTPTMDEFTKEWVALMLSKSGERGIFNREAALRHRPKRRAEAVFGGNPCLEIILRPFQFCNLSIVVARPDDTAESLRRKVRLATYFGKIQSMATQFRYIRSDFKRNCEEERLLGVDITGHADCPLLRPGAQGRAELLRQLKAEVDAVDKELSARWGIAVSAANTCVKPSGDSSVFFNCASGVSPWHGEHFTRWVREPKTTPIARFLRDSGVPYHDAPERPEELSVFGFPRAAPAGATLRNDLTALQQLENWLEWKVCWAEHSVSATIYVEDWEWLDVAAWVYKHFEHITGLSFLPKDNGMYTFAPNETLTPAAYAAAVAAFPALNWAKLTRYEDEDETQSRQTMACVGGGCD